MPAACWNAPTSSCRPRPAVNEPAWLAKKIIKGGHDAYFVRAYELMEDLRKVRAKHDLDWGLRVYPAPKVLVVDESVIRACYRDTAFLTMTRSNSFSNGDESFGRYCHWLPSQTNSCTTAVCGASMASAHLREKWQVGFPSRVNLSVHRRRGPSATKTTAGIPQKLYSGATPNYHFQRKTKCPVLQGDFATESPLLLNSPPTLAPAGVAECCPTELSVFCS